MPDQFNLAQFNLLTGEMTVRNAPILFDGHAITDYAPYANILDIRVGAAQIETRSVQPGSSPGSLFVSRKYRSRLIEIDVELPLDKASYAENAHQIRLWAHTTEPKETILTSYPTRFIMGICTNINEISLRDYWKPITLQFTCLDPYFYSRQARSEAVNTPFTIEGDDMARLYITYDLGASQSLTSPSWIVDSGDHITLNKTVTGGVFTIDMERQNIERTGESLISDMTLSSRFPDFMPGNHLITGPSGGSVTWYERWV